jgi:hypothetical protein
LRDEMRAVDPGTAHHIPLGGDMPARLRKLIGGVGILVFLLFYMGLVAMIADHLPNHWAVHLVFFLMAGTAWGAPLIPLITWMNRGR